MPNKRRLVIGSPLARTGLVFWEEGSFPLHVLLGVPCTSRRSKMVEALKDRRQLACILLFGCSFVCLCEQMIKMVPGGRGHPATAQLAGRFPSESAGLEWLSLHGP